VTDVVSPRADLAYEDIFLPEPEPREVRYTIISVDDHLSEPAHMFEGRLPKHLQDRAPKIVRTPDGHDVWEFDGERYVQIGQNAVSGRKPEHMWEAVRFDQIRKGCYEIEARIHDMDINGVWGSMSFPSLLSGFCGRIFSACSDPELGAAVTRAWNDWMFEEWYSPHPDRIIPLALTILNDPKAAAAEIRRNAERGVVSVSLPERPHLLGYPSVFSGYWDPVVEACVETDTIISLHVGSSGQAPLLPEERTLALGATLFGQMSLAACAEWLWSGYAVRYPEVKIAMSEGGIGWVPMLIDRLENIVDRSKYGQGWDARPADILRRNFWFCTIDDPSTISLRHVIGVDHIMFEVDYPHGDSTWPDTQDVLDEYWGDIPNAEIRKMCCENASKLYRIPLPAKVLPEG
jgi:predicted TIM-barrel fold metal-dependent hydrolase